MLPPGSLSWRCGGLYQALPSATVFAMVTLMGSTFYDVLMISPAADSRLLAVVYRHLAKRYHPDVDRSPEAAARMAELNEAYATLSDRTMRAHYDEQVALGMGRTTQDSRGEGDSHDQQGEADGGSDV